MDIVLPTHSRRQQVPVGTYVYKTNFYPRYGAANDQVDRILAIHPIYFQRVIPRYRLSTSETRDLGVGPVFDAAVLKTRYDLGVIKSRLERLPPWKGRYIDILT